MYIFKYKISIGETLLSGFFLLLSISALLVIILILLRDYSTFPTIGIIGMVIAWLFLFVMMLSLYSNFRTDLSYLRENRRNPTIIIDDSSIVLPFEKNDQPIKILFKDINECKEGYVPNKKRAPHFIYISVLNIIKKDTISKYYLYKKNMKPKDYEEFKNILLQKR